MMNRMLSRTITVVLFLSGTFWQVTAQPAQPARAVEELRAQLEQQVGHPRFAGATWSVSVVSLETGMTVFEHDPRRLSSPASNSKLYTGALALDRLGADYRILTPILAGVRPDTDGTVTGDVIVSGRGDPSWVLRPGRTNFWEVFDPFVTAISNAGVRRITGDIVADATHFRQSPAGAGWTVDDLDYTYGAEISAISLLLNCAQVRISPGSRVGQPCEVVLLQPHTGIIIENRTETLSAGASGGIQTRRNFGERTLHVTGGLPVGGDTQTIRVTVPRPVDWFAGGLKEALERAGITVVGSARGVRWPEVFIVPKNAVKLAELTSPPMGDLVRSFMKPSQNLETDLIFGHVGETTRRANTPATRTTEDLAVAALRDFLTAHQLPAEDLHFEEGSGLSRNNLTSARLTAGLLRVMASHRYSNEFRASLPVAGVDGTLARRMRDTPAEGNVRAKTGTLRWANALSGYVTTAAGEPLAFSLLLNRSVAQPGRTSRDELDAATVMLAGFAGRSDTTLASVHAPQGTLILTQMIHAPFPHPARMHGHTHREQFFPGRDHYTDSTVAIFVPQGLRGGSVDVVVHFHGWNNSVEGVLRQFQLIEQFAASRRQAVLVIPAGPRFAPDSFAGKMEDTGGFQRFVGEVLEVLRAHGLTVTGSGNIILSGHSGGYRAMASILARGGITRQVREVWVFDGWYAGTETFLGWQQAQKGRLVNFYTDDGGTLAETERAMTALRERRATLFTGRDEEVTEDELRRNRLLFLQTDAGHHDVLTTRENFRRLLETSSLRTLGRPVR